MKDARVILDARNASRTAAGVVCTGLVLRIDAKDFPERGWTDFSVAVLSSFVDAVVSLLQERPRVSVRFMEGPFRIDLTRESNEAWRIVVVETGERETILNDSVIDARALMASLVEAAEEALLLCRMREWWSSDAESLRDGLSRLRVS